jgi:predicted ATPase
LRITAEPGLPSTRGAASTDNLTRAQILSFPAVQLFIERASASMDSFELHDSELPMVAQVCSRLEGNPLAIELAAACVDVFGIRGLVAGLTDCLRLLTRGRRTALPRHQSLRATLDWSYELLSPVEQVLLRRLAVFSVPFDMESANIVAADSEVRLGDVFDTLTNLVAKSLLTTEGERRTDPVPASRADPHVCVRETAGV